MPFGLHSAPATFQRAPDSEIGHDMEPHAFAYLDDIIVISAILEKHKENLSCQKFKASLQKQLGKMLTRPVKEPFAVLCAVFVGPLPRSRQGNTLLLVSSMSSQKRVDLASPEVQRPLFPSRNIALIRLPGNRKGRLANIADLKAFHFSTATSEDIDGHHKPGDYTIRRCPRRR